MNDPVFLLDQLNSFTKSLDDTIIGIFLIRLHDWNIVSFVPILYLSKTKLYLQLQNKSISIPLSDISELATEGNVLYITYDGEKIGLSLVEINKDFRHISDVYTVKFRKLIDKLITIGTIDYRLLSTLPNQKSVGDMSNRGTILLITGLFFIALSFILQMWIPTAGWFFLFSGFIISIIGLFYSVFGKRLN